MNLIKTLALLVCFLGISNVCFADFDVLSLDDTIKLSSNIVKATPIFEQEAKIREHIEITIWEFKGE